MRLLGGLDQRHDIAVAPVADQLDRIGIAVDDLLEEGLAVLIGRQRRLGPAPGFVEQNREPRVGLAEAVGDLALDPLGQRR